MLNVYQTPGLSEVVISDDPLTKGNMASVILMI